MVQAIKNKLEIIDILKTQLVLGTALLIAIACFLYGFFAVNKAFTASRLMGLEKQSASLLAEISEYEGALMQKEGTVTMNSAEELGFNSASVIYVTKKPLNISLSLVNQ